MEGFPEPFGEMNSVFDTALMAFTQGLALFLWLAYLVLLCVYATTSVSFSAPSLISSWRICGREETRPLFHRQSVWVYSWGHTEHAMEASKRVNSLIITPHFRPQMSKLAVNPHNQHGIHAVWQTTTYLHFLNGFLERPELLSSWSYSLNTALPGSTSICDVLQQEGDSLRF